MQLAKIGTGVGLGMVVLGVVSRAAAKRSPKADPTAEVLSEGGGSLIVFGATLVFVSSVLAKREKP